MDEVRVVRELCRLRLAYVWVWVWVWVGGG